MIAATICTNATEIQRFEVTGKGKIRFRYAGATGDSLDSIPGIYGEYLNKGFDFRGRLDLELGYRLADALSLGAAVRITNEESDAVLWPPDLVSSRVLAGWWWAELQQGIFNATVGAYDASFTPLTLMRWDPADNPLGAGASCCAVTVGGLRGESLEELTEDYKLEGVKVVLKPGPTSATLIFGRPALASESLSYARYLGGIRAGYDLFCPWAQTGAKFGLTALQVADDRESVNEASVLPLCSDVVGGDFDIPVTDRIALVGEYAYSMRNDNTADTVLVLEQRDHGASMGLRFGDREQLDGRFQYIRTGTDFAPLFRAQSVLSNRHGFRASLARHNIFLGQMAISISGYVKYQQEFKPFIGDIPALGRYPGNFWIVTLSSRFEPWYEVSFGLDGELRRNSRQDDPDTGMDESLDVTEIIGSALFAYNFTPQNSVQLKYSLMRHTEPTDRCLTYLPSLELSVRF